MTVSADGGSSSLLGSSSGSWQNGGCTNGNTVGIQASEGQWTAPDDGSVLVGGTTGGGRTYGVNTIQVKQVAPPLLMHLGPAAGGQRPSPPVPCLHAT